MEFKGQYLTYLEYKGLGGTLDLMPFNLLEFEARKKINNKTFNRLVESKTIPQEVKLCEYKMINSLQEFSSATSSVNSNGNIASENTDGYSVSYVTADKIGEIVKSKSDELNDIIRTYLLNVIVDDEHIMYVGVE